MRDVDEGTQLFALWLFILMNIVFRDLHEFAKKDFLEMLLTGTYNGIQITEELLLLGGVLSLVPISMLVVSLLLERRFAKPLTFGAAFIQTVTMLSSPPGDLDDILHLSVELLAMAAILRIAWRWRAAPLNDAAALLRS